MSFGLYIVKDKLNKSMREVMLIRTLGFDEGLTSIKDGGTCLRRLSMFRKEVH